MMSGPGNRMPLLARVRRREHAGDQGGFTMVEVVMSIFIFGIVITGVIAGMSSALNLTRQDRNRSIAANLASQEMDTVRKNLLRPLGPERSAAMTAAAWEWAAGQKPDAYIGVRDDSALSIRYAEWGDYVPGSDFTQACS